LDVNKKVSRTKCVVLQRQKQVAKISKLKKVRKIFAINFDQLKASPFISNSYRQVSQHKHDLKVSARLCGGDNSLKI